MKRLKCLILLCLVYVSGSAQLPSLSIAADKTSSLIFPFPIRHVDCGTKAILVQPVKGVDNILLVKASVVDFAETNLSVVTSDGSLYCFVVEYEANPAELVYHLSPQKKLPLSSYSQSISLLQPSIKRLRQRDNLMQLSITGLYINEGILYFQLQISNESAIDYDVDELHLSIRDRRQVKRTAVQEQPISVLQSIGNTKLIKAFQANTIVLAIDKFTIPDAKLLVIQLTEKNGGRHLKLKVKDSQLLQVKPLPGIL